eukprot:281430-Chlamydomonas_euryale.AAC.1
MAKVPPSLPHPPAFFPQAMCFQSILHLLKAETHPLRRICLVSAALAACAAAACLPLLWAPEQAGHVLRE